MLDKCYTIIDNQRHFNFRSCAHYLHDLGQQTYGTNFKLKKEDTLLLHQLLSYATGSENQCQKYGIELQKGILLTGPVGCGKTSLMTILQEFMFQHQKYQVKNTRSIAAEFHKEGFETIHKYGLRQHTLCLDDLGAEQNIKHFGNECNTIGEILLHRYDIFIKYGILTHATTNLNANELEDIYGIRVRSRLRSMFNLVSFPVETTDKRT